MSIQATVARGDLRAYEESVRLTTRELVERLRDLLGAKLVAYPGSVQETRAVRQRADPGDARTPSTDLFNRLRMASGADDAFAYLKRMASTQERKLIEVAKELVRTRRRPEERV